MNKIISVVVTLFMPGLLCAQDLSYINNNIPEGLKSIVLTADIDIDGLPDLFVAGETITVDFAGLYQNKGDSTFFDLGMGLPYLADASACFTDLNNDAYPDLLYTGIDASLNYKFFIYINQKNNTFSTMSHTIPGIRFGSIKCSDMDHDGWTDIFITGYSNTGNIASVYKNNGNLSFSKLVLSLDGLRNGSAVIADFDRNSYPDIIYTGINSSLVLKTYYYQNNGNMEFAIKTSNLPSIQSGGIEICDINNDGYTDIGFYGKDNSDTHIANFYRNNAGLSFTLFSNLQAIREGAIKTSDFNNDGYPDAILTGIDAADNYRTILYTNAGGTGFSIETDTITDIGYSDALWFDFNKDSKNDILICGTTLSDSKALLISSNTTTVNQPPAILSGLKSIVSNDTVNLSWDKGLDNETSSNGLTYDLYLLKDGGGTIKFQPTANLTSGERHVMQSGALSTNNISLAGLDEGKYYWSVQSVDASFKGSLFAVTDSFYISQPVDLGNDTSICIGNTINFSLLSVDGSFKWYHSVNPALPISETKTVSINITQKDTIWVEITKPYGDKLYDTVRVDIHTLPTVNLGSDLTICTGQEVNLSMGTASDTVRWNTMSGAYTEIKETTFSHPFYSNDEIYVNLTDINSCTNQDTVKITVNPLPVINLINDTTLCKNNILQLNIGILTDSINWYSLTNATQVINSNTFSYEVLQNGSYKIEWYDQNRCANYDTIHIFARALPVVEAGEDKLICSGINTIIGPDVITTGWSYLWAGNGIITGQDTANPTVQATSETKYYLAVSDEYGCAGSDSMTVKINPVGIIDIGGSKQICIGGSVKLGGEPTAQGSIFPYTYEWSPKTSLDNFTSPNPVANPLQTTTYSLIVFTGYCPVDTLETTVTVNQLPKVEIMNDTIAGFKQDVALWALGGTNYNWAPAIYLDNALSQSPVANLEKTTRFTVKVTDENNCADTAGVTIFIKNELFIPELFTPNNDGNNDYFILYGFGIKEIQLLVFNKNGNIVFESNQVDEILTTGWNGEDKGGQVESGKYFWKITGEYYSGEKILFKGKDTGVVTILR